MIENWGVFMEWFKKHADTVTVLGGILLAVLWMNGKFSDVNQRFSTLEKEIAVIKTVLIMKEIMPKEYATHHELQEHKMAGG